MRHKRETLEPQCDVQRIKRGRHHEDTFEQTNKGHSRVFSWCTRACSHASSLRPRLACCCACCSAHSCRHFSRRQCFHILTDFYLYLNFLSFLVIVHTAKTCLLRCCLYTVDNSGARCTDRKPDGRLRNTEGSQRLESAETMGRRQRHCV